MLLEEKYNNLLEQNKFYKEHIDTQRTTIEALKATLELKQMNYDDLLKENIKLKQEIGKPKEPTESTVDKVQFPVIVGDRVFFARTTKITGGRKFWVDEACIDKIGCDKLGWYIIANNVRSKLSTFNWSWFKERTQAEERVKELENKYNKK